MCRNLRRNVFFHEMEKMTSLVPIQPQTSTICQVTPEALPKFPFSGYAGGAAQIP